MKFGPDESDSEEEDGDPGNLNNGDIQRGNVPIIPIANQGLATAQKLGVASTTVKNVKNRKNSILVSQKENSV